MVRYKYDAWGNITNTTGSIVTGNGKLLSEENPFRYVGYPYDSDTGYYYLKTRYYAPTLGRFTSLDPYKDHRQDPVSQNLYLYSVNNPIKYYDPSGNMYLSIKSSVDDKNDIITLQCKLQFLGFFNSTINGLFGLETEAAVIAYQTSRGLAADGVVGDLTWGRLKQDIPGDFILAQGSTGINVTKLQQELNWRGYGNLSGTGYFGPSTEAAVNYYKDTKGLGNDGIYRGKVGSQTWEILFNSSPIASKVITSKINLEKLGYTSENGWNLRSHNNLGRLDDAWTASYDEALWDFIYRYGKRAAYESTAASERLDLLCGWIQDAADGLLNEYDWYYGEMPDGNGGITKIYVTDTSVNLDPNNPVQAIVAHNEDSLGKIYNLVSGQWTDTQTYAILPDTQGTVYYVSNGSIASVVAGTSTSGEKIFKIDFEKLKVDIANKLLEQIGLAFNDLEQDEVQMLLLGIAVGLDDNYFFGAFQKLGNIQTFYDDYHFVTAKVLVDSGATIFWAKMTVDTAATAAALFAQSAAEAAAGGLAIATVGAAPAGAALGGAAVATAIEGAVCSAVSIIAAKSAVKSKKFLDTSLNAKTNLPTYNSGNFRENLKKFRFNIKYCG